MWVESTRNEELSFAILPARNRLMVHQSHGFLVLLPVWTQLDASAQFRDSDMGCVKQEPWFVQIGTLFEPGSWAVALSTRLQATERTRLEWLRSRRKWYGDPQTSVDFSGAVRGASEHNGAVGATTTKA
jgi:hypothetical protein